MNDDEYMCLDMYGLLAEYDELLVPTACWPAAPCEPDDRSDECVTDVVVARLGTATSVSIDCTEPAITNSSAVSKNVHFYSLLISNVSQ